MPSRTQIKSPCELLAQMILHSHRAQAVAVFCVGGISPGFGAAVRQAHDNSAPALIRCMADVLRAAAMQMDADALELELELEQQKPTGEGN